MSWMMNIIYAIFRKILDMDINVVHTVFVSSALAYCNYLLEQNKQNQLTKFWSYCRLVGYGSTPSAYTERSYENKGIESGKPGP